MAVFIGATSKDKLKKENEQKLSRMPESVKARIQKEVKDAVQMAADRLPSDIVNTNKGMIKYIKELNKAASKVYKKYGLHHIE